MKIEHVNFIAQSEQEWCEQQEVLAKHAKALERCRKRLVARIEEDMWRALTYGIENPPTGGVV